MASSPRLAMMRVEPVNLDSFRASLEKPTPPEGLSLAAQALWWDAKDDWTRAHECAQQDEGKTGSSVHAYLHRREDDLENARYWYRQARKRPATGPIEAEWAAIAADLLAKAG